MFRPLGIEYASVGYHVLNWGADYRGFYCMNNHCVLFLDFLHR